MAAQFRRMAMWTWPGAVYNEHPQRMVERLQEGHVDIVIPYICGQRDGHTCWTAEEYDERLRAIIEEAHRADMKVHACFDEVNAYRAMPVYDLRQVRKDGSIGSVLCHANPAVVDYVLYKLRWTLAEFDCDGINLEDGYIFNQNTIYDPAHTTGELFQVVPVCYCSYCQEHAPIEKPEWAQWKQEQLTALIAAESALVRKQKPGAPFSVAARMPYDRSFYAPHKQEVPYFDGWEVCQSRDALMADWAAWLRRGHIDFACPMSYFHSRRLVELETQECRHLSPTAANDIWIGLGLGECTAEYRQGNGDDPATENAKDPALRNDGAAIEALLLDQLRVGQEKVVFFSYEHLLDEHLSVMARYR